MMQFFSSGVSKRVKSIGTLISSKRSMSVFNGQSSPVKSHHKTSSSHSCQYITRQMGTILNKIEKKKPGPNSSGLIVNQKANYNQKFDNLLEPLLETEMEKIRNKALITNWLDPNSPVANHEKLTRLAPEMIEFVMGFADFNIYFLRYVQPYTTFFQDIINKHTIENRTHSKLFTRDWRLLNVDKYVEWDLADYMSWTLSPSVSPEMKAEVLKLYDLVLHHPHPLIRYSIMEVIEGAGLIFFTKTAPLADELQKKTGFEYKYFGTHHLQLEDGGIGLPTISQEDQEEIEKEKALEIEQLNDMYGHYSDEEIKETVSHVVKETGKTFQQTFDFWYDIANQFSKGGKYFYHKKFKEDENAYLNTSFMDNVTQQPHSFFCPSGLMMNLTDNNDDYLDLSSQVYDKFSSSANIQEAILPFALIDLLGIAFICGSDSRHEKSNNEDEKFYHNMSQTIGKMGHALIYDYRNLGWGNDFSNDMSSLLRYKFFSPRSDLHRTNFASWFKAMLKEKDMKVRAVYLQITMDVYKHLLHGFYDCVHRNVKDIDLHLMNGKWFYYFNKNFSNTVNSFRNNLSTKQQEKVLLFRNNLVKNLEKEIKATKVETLSCENEEQVASNLSPS